MKYNLIVTKDAQSDLESIADYISETLCNPLAALDFLDDIEKKYLYVGLIDEKISVVYAINMEYDVQYKNGSWEYPDRDFRIIHRLCVNPLYQNQGIAKETLNYIESELKENGVESIRLDVFLENPYALSLYRKNGYKEVGMANWRKGHFYLMEKHL